jgi:hypothetical protein
MTEAQLAEIERDHDHDVVHRLVSEIRRMRALMRMHGGVRTGRWPHRNEMQYPRWIMEALDVVPKNEVRE